MDIFADFGDRVRATIARLGWTAADGAPLDLSRVVVEPPRDAAHGDLAVNAAMVLAKPMGKNPRALAIELMGELAADPDIAETEVAGPGFLNLRLTPAYWGAFLARVVAAGRSYGRGTVPRGAVNVEYVSANPTGPMHVGHCRGAVVGDALANLLAFAGHAVTKEYYINDAGAQVDVLARSAHLRYLEALGETITIPEGLYPGDYLKPIGAVLAARYGDAFRDRPESEWLDTVRTATIDAMMVMIRADLAALNVVHDVFFSEKSLQTGPAGDRVAEAIATLRDAGLMYEGRLEPPKGQLPEDWEDREQTLFRSTAYGDDVDRPLMKSDGSYTYFASDIAYHLDKYRRGFRDQIDIWGADHGGYVKRMKAAVGAISGGEASLDVELCQLVKLYRAGEPVKMSKRSGDFVTLRDVVDEVGVDAVRFMMLFRKSDAPLDFDFQKVTEQSKDNPVFYVQYAHARTASVFVQAREGLPGLDLSDEGLVTAPLERLVDSGEIGLMKRIAQWPRVVEAAAEAHEPHRIAFFLHDLASDLHGHWNRGKDLPQLRFVNVDDPLSSHARLAMVRAVAVVLASGLAVLGVNAPDEMR
ncbi:arginine--tRNA ligase [Siculibacillus lacustris]|uniref:Arginine--tRNA ligase n=1 Tax=Siculibacillus lacustris TaxID=1549641 RepID=A0A4Q9VQL2_9HYPH|nr:arginine--tRNA ligase [Siculibacillus lacustris]TBW37990.1 arginine--tRNA ligase [Siculibacillus lacustris]